MDTAMSAIRRRDVDVSYINPTSMMVISTLLPALAIVALIARFVARMKQQVRLSWDDWLLVPGLLLTIGSAIAQIIGIVNGAVGTTKGVPAGSPPIAELFYISPRVILFEQVQFAVQMMQPLALGFIKASFIMFYRRIFYVGHRTGFSVFTSFMLILIPIWSIAFCLCYVLYCGTHVSAIWSTVLDIMTYCPNSFQFQEAFAISDFILDLIIIIIPIPAVLKLQMEWSRKFSVLLIFMLGVLAIAASLIRMVVVIIVSVIGFDVNLDGDIFVCSILFWSMVENCVALIAACLPTLHFILNRRSIEGMLKSVRSKFSLSSLRSSTSSKSPSSTSLTDKSASKPITTTNATESYHLSVLRGVSSVQSHVGHDSEPDMDMAKMEQEHGGILVQKDVRQEESYQ